MDRKNICDFAVQPLSLYNKKKTMTIVKIESRFAVRIKGQWKEQGGGEQFVNLDTLPATELQPLMDRMSASDGLAYSIYHVKGETDRILYLKILKPVDNQGWVAFRECIAEYDFTNKEIIWHENPNQTLEKTNR